MQPIKTAYDRIPFQTKVMLLMTILIFSIFLVLTMYIFYTMQQSIKAEIGEKALAVSETIAHSPDTIKGFEESDPSRVLQPLANSIQEEIDAEYIVIGNTEEIRYAHPIEDRLGKKMVGDDNERALEKGESYISEKEGSLGPAIRGKSPVIQNGEVVGVVSVGYLLSDVNSVIWNKNQPIILLFFLFLLIGMGGAVFIGKHLKRLLFQMEPQEIAVSLMQKEAILESAKEGIVAVDTSNIITSINEAARELLNVENKTAKELIGQSLSHFTSVSLLDKASDRRPNQDREVILEQDIVLMNIYNLIKKEERFGAVAIFRRKTELENVTKELTNIQQYADGLRAQTHEFTNKLHTISGLLQLNHVEEALSLIQENFNQQTQMSESNREEIKDPAIQALLIAKQHQAEEKGIRFFMQEESQLEKTVSSLYQDVLLKIVGNLLDNAFQAVTQSPEVHLFMTDMGQDIIIEVDDNGPGIPPGQEETIFQAGYTTKESTDNGKGLSIVQKAVHLLQGHIFIEPSELGGARFLVIIPKEDHLHEE